MNFSGSTSGKNLACQHRRCKRHGFDPWVRKIPWSRNWQLPLVFLSRKSVDRGAWWGYSRWWHKESDMNEWLNSKPKILHGDDCFSWLAETSWDRRNFLPRIMCFIACTLPFSSVAQSCLTLCDPMDCSMPVLSVHHQLPEFTQTHVHWVGDAIQPSHPLVFPSPPAFNSPSIRVFSSESVLHIRWPKY